MNPCDPEACCPSHERWEKVDVVLRWTPPESAVVPLYYHGGAGFQIKI